MLDVGCASAVSKVTVVVGILYVVCVPGVSGVTVMPSVGCSTRQEGGLSVTVAMGVLVVSACQCVRWMRSVRRDSGTRPITCTRSVNVPGPSGVTVVLNVSGVLCVLGSASCIGGIEL